MSASEYRPEDFPPFAVTVDIVLLSVTETLRVLLIERGVAPFKGRMALPGGFVQIDDSFFGIRPMSDGTVQIEDIDQGAVPRRCDTRTPPKPAVPAPKGAEEREADPPPERRDASASGEARDFSMRGATSHR